MSLFNVFKPEKKLKPLKLTTWEKLHRATAPTKKMNTKTIEIDCDYDSILWGGEKWVFYLEDSYNPVANELFSKYHKEITRKFEQVGYTFIYIPQEVEKVFKYYSMPMPDVEWNAATMFEILQCHCNESIGVALAVVKESDHIAPSKKTLYCTLLEADSQEGLIAILKAVWESLDDDDSSVRFRLNEDGSKYDASYGEEACFTRGFLFTEEGESAPCEREEQYRERKQCRGERKTKGSAFLSPVIRRVKKISNEEFLLDRFYGEELSEEDEQLLKEIQVRVTKLRQNGIKQHLIEQFIKMTIPTSHLEVTADARILLTDYDKEVPMLPIDKVVYIFYLRHPEGVSIKSLADHKEELVELYARILGKKGLTDKQRASVERLCTPFDNSINEKLSRIRKSFCAVVHESIANHYVVKGMRGTSRSITLDEELIVADEWMR